MTALGVPGQLAVVGVGDQAFAQDLEPALTTVRIDGTAIGSIAAGFIIERAAGRVVAEPVRDIGFSLMGQFLPLIAIQRCLFDVHHGTGLYIACGACARLSFPAIGL